MDTRLVQSSWGDVAWIPCPDPSPSCGTPEAGRETAGSGGRTRGEALFTCRVVAADPESEGQALRVGTGEFPGIPAEKQLMHICFGPVDVKDQPPVGETTRITTRT